jgi:DNA-binding phage protein
MLPFSTTPKQIQALPAIVRAMEHAGLHPNFIRDASELARVCEGTFDLMLLWSELEAHPAERDEVIADIQDSIDDVRDAPPVPVHIELLRLDQLDEVLASVVAGKAKLRALIDQHGGVSTVAQQTEIPEPSLNRMLNSGAMARRSTLLRIADALRLSEADVVQQWMR